MLTVLKTTVAAPEQTVSKKDALHEAALELLAIGLNRADSASFPDSTPSGLPDITRLEYGKPVFSGDIGWHFSLSHSGDVAVCALTDECPLGVDVQRASSATDIARISERFFSSEEQMILASRTGDMKRLMFFRIFSCKEAYIKMTGSGLSEDLRSFSVSPGLTEVTKGGAVTGYLHVFEELSEQEGSSRVPYTLAVCAPRPCHLKNSLISV